MNTKAMSACWLLAGMASALAQGTVRGVICSGAARLNNGSVVTLDQPFVGTMSAAGGGMTLQAGIVPTFSAAAATNEFAINPSVSLANGRFKLGFIVAPGRSWVVLGSTNLTSWEPVWAGTATDPLVEFEDTTAFFFTRRFYRVWLP